MAAATCLGSPNCPIKKCISHIIYDSDDLAYDSWNCKNQDRFGNRHTAKQLLYFFSFIVQTPHFALF